MKKIKKIKKDVGPFHALTDLTLGDLLDFCNRYIGNCKECPMKKIMLKNGWKLSEVNNTYCYYLLGFRLDNIRGAHFVQNYKLSEKDILGE